MKDYVEFLKWLHKKGIPFREGWIKLELQTTWVLVFKPLINSHCLISNDFSDSLVLCAFLEKDFLVQVLML
jgi:hypothetical protein